MTEGQKPMRETAYRASRWFRVLGNPLAYQIVTTIGKERQTVTEIARSVGQPLDTVSHALRNLRQVDIVRYETAGLSKAYWIKDRRTLVMLRNVERMVERMRGQQW